MIIAGAFGFPVWFFGTVHFSFLQMKHLFDRIEIAFCFWQRNNCENSCGFFPIVILQSS